MGETYCLRGIKMKQLMLLIEEMGVPLRKHRDYSEGILAMDDFMDYLVERRRYGDADYVYVRGSDDVLEVSFLEEEEVGRAVKSVR